MTLSAQKNTIVRSVAPRSIFEDATEVVGSLTCNQGDFLVFTGGVLAKPALESEGNVMLGIAQQTLVSGKPASPYQGTAVDAAQSGPAQPGPVCGVIARCVPKTGDAFTKGCAVYLYPTVHARGVSSSGTKKIGVYQGATIASALSGNEIECLIGSRYPDDSLSF